MQKSTIVLLFGLLAIAIGYAMNHLSEKQDSIRGKQLVYLARNIAVAAVILACGYILSDGDYEGLLVPSIILGIFVVINYKRAKFCGVCGTRNTARLGAPNEICRKCGVTLP